jgi:hypothetical protein
LKPNPPSGPGERCGVLSSSPARLDARRVSSLTCSAGSCRSRRLTTTSERSSYSLCDLLAADPAVHPSLINWLGRLQQRASVERDSADVMETLTRLQAEKRPAFDPYLVQWRSDRLEWVIKNGFADWFREEIKAGRAFFPLT